MEQKGNFARFFVFIESEHFYTNWFLYIGNFRIFWCTII